MEKFIDLCILCGCDYTTNIPGIGPIKAYNYIDCYENIENTLVKIEHENENPYKKKKHHIPETFMFKEARDLFKNPNVVKDLKVLEN
jgi:flap endonuclease-1